MRPLLHWSVIALLAAGLPTRFPAPARGDAAFTIGKPAQESPVAKPLKLVQSTKSLKLWLVGEHGYGVRWQIADHYYRVVRIDPNPKVRTVRVVDPKKYPTLQEAQEAASRR